MNKYAPLLIVGFVVGSFHCAVAQSPSRTALTKLAIIPLESVQGRIDHFALDAEGGRLFVAALGNNTVEVVDVNASKVMSQLKGLATPQGVAFSPDLNRLAVANDEDGSLRIYDGKILRPTKKVSLGSDADNVRYDRATGRFWVGFGDGALAELDAKDGKVLGRVKLAGHPESFQLETKGNRIFVNVPGAGHVAVIDRDKKAVIAKWPITAATSNFPMALDEQHGRLLVGCREPAKLLVLDTDSGKTVASATIVGDTDDVFYDAKQQLVYVAGGGGSVTILRQDSPDKYELVEQVATAPGARTAYFSPALRRLWIAVPKTAQRSAQLFVFQTPGDAK